MDSVSYRSSATTRNFQKITAFVYIFTGTNFWIEDVDLPSVFVKFNKSIWKFLEVIIIAFVLTQSGAMYTQDLTEMQKTDVITKSILSLFACTTYVCTFYHKEGIKELVMTLAVTLKKMFNDEKVEKMMIRKNYLFQAVIIMGFFCTMTAFGVEAAVHSLTSNATFTTVIPIWPDLEDRSLVAGVVRVIIYIVWVLMFAHIMSIYIIIITVSICLEHQFATLYEYFLSLNDIFNGDDSSEEQEQKYENAIKDGIKMHCITLKCVDQLQTTCHMVYSGQIVLDVCLTVLLMIQMVKTERTLIELAPIAVLAAGIRLYSGFFICSAADITVEAQRLPTAIFHSGWHNCRGKSSVRMRKTITIAMAQAQRPVVIKVLGIIELSYESYVAIVKASYSVFSVIY